MPRSSVPPTLDAMIGVAYRRDVLHLVARESRVSSQHLRIIARQTGCDASIQRRITAAFDRYLLIL